MRQLKGMLAGALALGGLMAMQTGASAQPLAAPELIHVTPVRADAGAAPEAAPCYWGWHRHYGWHRGWYRHYGWHPGWGWHHRYGWRRPWGWHRHYGWHRW